MSTKVNNNDMILIFNKCLSLSRAINADVASQVEANENLPEGEEKQKIVFDKDLLAELSANFEKIIQFITIQLISKTNQVLFGYLLAEIGDLSIDYSINSFTSLDVSRTGISLVMNPLYMEDKENGEALQFSQMVTQVISDLTKMMYDHPAIYAKEKKKDPDNFKHGNFIEAGDINSTETLRRDFIQSVRSGEVTNGRINIPAGMQTRTKAEAEYKASAQAEQDVEYYSKYVNKYKPVDENQGSGSGQDGEGDGENQSQGGESSPEGGNGRQSNDWSSVNDEDAYNDMVRQIMSDALNNVPQSQRGLVPGNLMEYIEEYLKPPIIPWQEILRRFVGGYPSGHRKSSLRLDRRQPENPLLKGKLSKKLVPLIIAIDTSGSMDRNDIEYAMSEIQEIIKNYKTHITIIECDMAIGRTYEVTKVTDMKYDFTGRGGTSFSPVIEFINSDRKYHGSILIYFTDGGGEYELTEVPRTRKNLWIMTRGTVNDLSLKEPYGEVKALADDPKYVRGRGNQSW